MFHCFAKRGIAKSPSLFSDWMVSAKIVKIKVPPVDVTNHFDELYQLKQVPEILAQVSIPNPHNLSLILNFQLRFLYQHHHI
jgi:hypothetical protein